MSTMRLRHGLILAALAALPAAPASPQAEGPGSFDRLIQDVQTAELQRALGLGPPGTPPPARPRPPGGDPGSPPARPAVGGRLTLKGYGPAEWAVRPLDKGAVKLDNGDLYLTVAEGEPGGLEAPAQAALRGDFDAELHFRLLTWEPGPGDRLVAEYRFASAGSPGTSPFAIRLTRSAGAAPLLEVVLEGRIVPAESDGRSLLLRRKGAALSLFRFAGPQGWLPLARWTAPPGDLAPTVRVQRTGRAAVQLVLMLRDGKGLVLPD
jgi:hypothetical protein